MYMYVKGFYKYTQTQSKISKICKCTHTNAYYRIHNTHIYPRPLHICMHVHI